ncbi:serine hydrolase domain-containing protein [Microbacterium sp. NPDC076911]|uniref:serine hydrolase domain-containing protein n=1 Tax=Microbacterium sp. NPDC076911 TaxID=3154958 RepID=UPI00341632E7
MTRARRRVAGATVAIFALSAALVGCSGGSQATIDVPEQVDQSLPAETVASLEEAVTSAMIGSGSPGAIVGVWAPWSGSWVAGLGTQEVGDGAAVTTDMQFRAGLVTREMTCDALFVAQAEGKLDVDDSVVDYVAGVPDLEDVTLRQLCDSTSGIGSHTSTLFDMWLQNPERVWDPQELASFGLGKERANDPGEVFSSSDTGYVLLGMALERATQMSAADYFEHYITQPLDLSATGLGSAFYGDTVLEGHISRKVDGAYDCLEPLNITSLSTSAGFTDSGAVTDIEDLGRYARALAAQSLMPDDSDRFDNPKPPSSGSPSWYTTIGGSFQAGSLIGQYGSVPGYLTAAFSDPETGMTVAVVLNNSAIGSTFVRNLAWELAAIASKAPAAADETAPEAGLPWTAEKYEADLAERAICSAPAE